MSQPHILADINEASSVVMKFIGTDKFDEVVSAVENNAKAGFTAGLSFALCLMMAESKTYLYHVEEQKQDEEKDVHNAKKVESIRAVANRTMGYCPSCGRGLDSYHDGNSGDHITHFCYNCGQAVKWE